MSENTSNFVERIAKSVTTLATSQIVFSSPIKENEIVIIPVAKVRYGLGGGFKAMPNDNEAQGGGGVGLGVIAEAIGYIEIKNGHALFKPIKNPVSLPALILTSGMIAFLMLKAIGKLLK